jgi:O-antigen/teichoic acid export membrane protein
MNLLKGIKSRLTDLARTDFIQNALLLLGGSFIAQLVSMGSAPVITRLFTPENLGVFALFNAIANIINGVSSLCYERAIVLPKKNDEAINLLSLTFLILFGVCLAIFPVLFVIESRLEGALSIDIHPSWVWLLPLAVLFMGLSRNFVFWRIRNKHFKAISTSKMLQAALAAVVKIIFGFVIGSFAGGLIAGFMIGILASTVFLLFKPEALRVKDYRELVSRDKMKELAQRYKKFPFFATWNSLMTLMSLSIIVFMFTIFFDAAVVGFYSLCNKFLGRPVSLVSESVQNAYFQKAAENLSSGADLKRNLKRITLGLMAIGFLPFLFLTFFGESLFGLVFGQDWTTAGQYVQVMTPWYFIIFIRSPSNVIYEVCEKQNIRLGFNIVLTVSRFLALLVGYNLSKDPKFSIMIFVIVSVVINACIILYSFVIVHSWHVLKSPSRSDQKS